MDGQSLRVKAAHLRLEDEAAVLVLVKPEFNLLPSNVRLQILDAFTTASRAERLQGEVIPVWPLPDGTHLGFLAEPRLHQRMKAVTLARVVANLNRQLKITAPSSELADVVAASDDGAGNPAGPKSANRRPRGEGDGSLLSGSGNAVSDIVLAEDPLAGVQLSPTFSMMQTPSGRFAKEGAAAVSPAAAAAPPTYVRAFMPAPAASALPTAPAAPVTPAASAIEHRPPANERPLRLVTMVFTDIVGSTEMKQRLGEHRAMEIIQWHHTTVREVLTLSHTGEEVSTAGDSFFLVFSAPSDAVRFALRLQARLRAGPGGGVVIQDRIGIHVGEVFLTTETAAGKVRDYYGMQVDTCARVMSLAGGDQILVTRFTADNARHTLRNTPLAGLHPPHWVCHGFYTLKGVDEPIEVFEVGERGVALMRTPSPDKRLHY